VAFNLLRLAYEKHPAGPETKITCSTISTVLYSTTSSSRSRVAVLCMKQSGVERILCERKIPNPWKDTKSATSSEARKGCSKHWGC
jgi:hypothetical protein